MGYSMILKILKCFRFYFKKVWKNNSFWCLLCARSCVKIHIHHLTNLKNPLKIGIYYCCYYYYYFYLHCTNEETEGQRIKWCVQGGSANKCGAEPGFPRLCTVALCDIFSIFSYTHISVSPPQRCEAGLDMIILIWQMRKLWLRKVKWLG